MYGIEITYHTLTGEYIHETTSETTWLPEVFETDSQAWDKAFDLADGEAEALNENCPPDRTFGVVEVYEDRVYVVCYIDGDEYMVTEYFIKKGGEIMMVYTHDEAAKIIESFEDILDKYDIHVPSPEDDEREEDNQIGLYGSVYSDLLDDVEDSLINLLKDCGVDDTKVVTGEFSGQY